MFSNVNTYMSSIIFVCVGRSRGVGERSRGCSVCSNFVKTDMLMETLFNWSNHWPFRDLLFNTHTRTHTQTIAQTDRQEKWQSCIFTTPLCLHRPRVKDLGSGVVCVYVFVCVFGSCCHLTNTVEHFSPSPPSSHLFWAVPIISSLQEEAEFWIWFFTLLHCP